MKKRGKFFAVVLCMLLCLSILPESYVASATKATFEMQKKRVTYKDGNIVRGVVYFQYPKLKGKPKEIAKINKVLENAMKTYMASETAANLKEYTLSAIEQKSFFADDERYYLKTFCKVTYNANNIISMHMKEMWYAGGVYNQSDYGFTFDLKTGKTLTAVDVISGTAKEVTGKVLSSAKKTDFKVNYENKDDIWKSVSSVINKYGAKNFKFYLTPKKANVCFKSYELEVGTSSNIFPVTSKYK